MTIATAWPYESGPDDRTRLFVDALPQRVFGGAALVCVALTCAWTICINLNASDDGGGVAPRADKLAFAARRGDRLAVTPLAGLAAANIGAAAFDERFAAVFPPELLLGTRSPAGNDLASAAPVRSRLAAPIALNPRLASRDGRRHGRGQPLVHEAEQPSDVAANAPDAEPSVFEKVFGSSPSSIFAKLFGSSPSRETLAYAASEAGATSDQGNLTNGLYDRRTAVYDISTHTVYMPDGTTLEAHSGLGSALDDPRSADERDRGATPPDLYDLQPRGAMFHGVHALRLIPVNEAKVFGRSGLLAHSYMLGPNGQSNGCVSFKDYDTFLKAYENHEITRLAVVSHI